MNEDAEIVIVMPVLLSLMLLPVILFFIAIGVHWVSIQIRRRKFRLKF